MKDGSPLSLTHEELISLTRSNPLLMPGEIPVHPSVYGADFAYKLDFLRRVHGAVPRTLEEDLRVIEQKLKVNAHVEVDNRRIGKGDSAVNLDAVGFFLSAGRYFSLQFGNLSIALGDKEGYESPMVTHTGLHPMSRERFEAYRVETGDSLPVAHAWSTNNTHDKGFYWKLYLRNFAIAFNNMALQEVR